MMKKTIVAVALLMVTGAAFAGEEATCGKACAVGRTVKHYGYVKPKEAVENVIDYSWNGHHSGSTVAVWGDRAIRLGGLYFVSTEVVAPMFAKAYVYISKQVKALRTSK